MIVRRAGGQRQDGRSVDAALGPERSRRADVRWGVKDTMDGRTDGRIYCAAEGCIDRSSQVQCATGGLRVPPSVTAMHT